MTSSNPKCSKTSLERYLNLEFKQFLSRSYQYPLACKELSFMLRSSYEKFPKNLQTQIFQDTLFAFDLLPEVQTQSAISSANSLMRSAEFALPKQKRALAVKAYKHAIVACKRKPKNRIDEEGLNMLPQDVLVHIFGFLDLESLISAAAVCRSWGAAASDNHLWKILHATFFGDPPSSSKLNGMIESREDVHFVDDTEPEIDIHWKSAFKNAYKGTCSKRLNSGRGFCGCCCSIVWLSSNECSNEECKLGSTTRQHINRLSTQQVVGYILDGAISSDSCSDSDSDGDTDNGSGFKLWAYAYPTIS